MYLVSNSTYPLSSAKEIATAFVKAATEPLPAYIKRTHTLTTAGDLGIRVLGIYEVEDEKVSQAIKDLTKYFVQYYEMEGFAYTLEPMLTAQEAIPLLGL